MRRSAKISILVTGVVMVAALVLAFYLSLNKIRSVLATTSAPNPATQAAVSSASPKAVATPNASAANAACEKCVDACVRSQNGDLRTLVGCEELCYDECHPGGGAKPTRPKLKHKLRP